MLFPYFILLIIRKSIPKFQPLEIVNGNETVELENKLDTMIEKYLENVVDIIKQKELEEEK